MPSLLEAGGGRGKMGLADYSIGERFETVAIT
jgi:hypothetical protein